MQRNQWVQFHKTQNFACDIKRKQSKKKNLLIYSGLLTSFQYAIIPWKKARNFNVGHLRSRYTNVVNATGSVMTTQ